MVVADWREKLALSPASVMLLTLLFIVLTQGAAVYTLLQQPWTGLRLQTDPLSGALSVASVSSGSPAEGAILSGTILTHVQFLEQSTPLSPQLFLSGFFNPTHAEYRAYLQHQEAIHSALRSGKPVAFIAQDGRQFSLLPQPYTPLSAIPSGFWLFSAVFLFIPLIGAFVWSYRPGLRETRLLLITCLTYYLFFFIGTSNLHKELAFSGEL